MQKLSAIRVTINPDFSGKQQKSLTLSGAKHKGSRRSQPSMFSRAEAGQLSDFSSCNSATTLWFFVDSEYRIHGWAQANCCHRRIDYSSALPGEMI